MSESEITDGGPCSSSSSINTSSSDRETTPRKKPRYSCTFHPESNTFDWARVSRKGPTYAFCSICKRDITVAYGGAERFKEA